MQKCIVCGFPHFISKDCGDRKECECRVCGRYNITGTAVVTFENKKVDPRFSGWLREKSESGRPATINSNTYDGILTALPHYSVRDKQVKILRAIEKLGEFAGQPTQLQTQSDYSLAYCANATEFGFHLGELENRRLVQRHGGGDLYTITTEGWDALDVARRQVDSDICFVAMAFSQEMTEVWDQGLEPAIRESGYTPYRVDLEPDQDRIDARIEAAIIDSKFVVVDVTHQRQSVYYEAGFAIGLGRPVIWSVEEADKKNVHFDSEHYQMIRWKDANDLKEKLAWMIKARIG